jgi:hypothetical protein
MKCVASWHCYDSFGRLSRVALAANGTYFVSYYGFNGYGMGFSKWRVREVDFNADGTLSWGFGSATKDSVPGKYRFPKL